MSARDLLQDLSESGVSVAADGCNLVIRPASKLTDTQRAALRQQKADVLALLACVATAANDPDEPAPEVSPLTVSTSVSSEIHPFRLPPQAADRCHAGGWSDAEIEGFTGRVVRFMARGLSASDADDLAEALTLRDRERDDRRLCLECSGCTGSASSGYRCRRALQAGMSPDTGRGSFAQVPGDVATLLQRCPGFGEMAP